MIKIILGPCVSNPGGDSAGVFPAIVVRFLSIVLSSVLLTAVVRAAPPELADPLAQENGSTRVVPTIPFGKTLVLPIAATDADDDLLEFRATSSNPRIFVRVKTANPTLHLHVDYAGDTQSTPPAAPFSGDLDFQLYRDLTPLAAETIAGLAQAGYYDDLLFHRIIPGFVAQAGDPAGNGSGLTDPNDPNSFIGLPFQFGHEFNPSLIFSGRGQLAMANSNGGYERGTNVGSGLIRLGDFSPTNGSQFFITYAQPRHLDFKHTIFGQLIRGFDILDKMAAVPRDTSDKPTVPVRMTNVSVRPGRHEATLLLSAIGLGSAMITVDATDPTGARATRRFQVTSVEDTINDPPVLRPIPNLISPVGKRPELPLKAFDLEQDYLLYGIASANGNTQAGSFGAAQITTGFSPRSTPGFQDLALGVAGFNDPRIRDEASVAAPFAPFEFYNFQVVEIGYGDRAIDSSAQAVEGTAGVALDQVVVAEFRDADVAGQPADFTAIVNWGDGTGEKTSTEMPAPSVQIERSSTQPAMLVVKATHTYASPGIYLVRVLIDAPRGATSTVRSHAIIAAAGEAMRAAGRQLEQEGPVIANRVIATFADTTPGVKATDFEARIDWGDGALSSGLIGSADGRFAVTGTHAYQNSASFAVQVYVHRSAPSTGQTVAWSAVDLNASNFSRTLPPFAMPHLVGQISTVPVDPQNSQGAQKQLKTTTGTGSASKTSFTASIVIVNAGNEKSHPGSLRFYLSADDKLNLTPLTNADNSVTPADVHLKIGSFPKATIPALTAGDGLRYNFDSVNGQDLRLMAPKGETGAGLNLLAVLDYHDDIADHMPITREVAFGPINGIIVAPTGIQVKEAVGEGHLATFAVHLDRAPTADVKIPLIVGDATAISIDKLDLTFTAANWNTNQIVTVTATDDAIKESITTTQVRLGVSDSTDPRWDAMDGPDVTVTVLDND